MIRFVHEDGSVRPAYPQSIMDNRNQAIPLDKITSRDITDTHRRGACMAAAMEFGLGYELWAKMPLESGYEQGPADSEEPPKQRSVTKEDFLQACLDKGLNTYAANELVSLIGVKYEAGMKTLMAKDEQWVNQKNAEAQSAALEEEGEAPPAKKRTTKRSPEEY